MSAQKISPRFAMFLIIAAMTVIFMIVGHFVLDPTRSAGVAPEDRNAYGELKQHGYSDKDAGDAASSVRGLCQASGGTNC